jgi:DNA-binding transcriptional LysR family regulator
MKVEQLAYIVEVVKLGSINQAANSLFVSQSALSSSIRQLEEELGEPIFIRKNKGVLLTPFGKDFLPYAKDILLMLQRVDNLSSRRSRNSGVKLSLVHSGYRFISDISAKIYRQYRGESILLEIHEIPTTAAVDLIADRIAEIGVIRIWNFHKSFLKKQLTDKRVQFFPVCTVPASVIVGRSSPLYTLEEDEVTLDMLKGYPQVVNTYIHTSLAGTIFNELPIPMPNSRIVVSSRASLYEILAKTDGYYVTATPRPAYRHTDYYPETRSLLLKDRGLTGEIGWIKNEDYNPSPIANEFVRLLNDYFVE